MWCVEGRKRRKDNWLDQRRQAAKFSQFLLVQGDKERSRAQSWNWAAWQSRERRVNEGSGQTECGEGGRNPSGLFDRLRRAAEAFFHTGLIIEASSKPVYPSLAAAAAAAAGIADGGACIAGFAGVAGAAGAVAALAAVVAAVVAVSVFQSATR